MTASSRSLLAPAYRWSTVGMVALVSLAAFEALAVTTVMPTVTAELQGRALYSAAFSATLAASVVGLVAAGLWADRHGPRTPLIAAVVVFAGGLLLAGLAPGMEVFVAARFLQGLGGGGLTVALYVVVGRIYAPVDHPRIFGAFAAAWVIPSLVGPSIAGVVADTAGWRWVFLGVVGLAAAALVMLGPALRSLADNPEPSEVATASRLALAAIVAVAVVVLDLVGRLEGVTRVVGVVLALVVVIAAVRPLVPPGTLVLRRGLPAVIALRGAIGATFFATEIYLPYLLQEQYDVPSFLAGATLTVGALGWAGASQVQARLGERLTHARAFHVGSVLLAAGVGAELGAAATHLPAIGVALAWVAAGAGMGLIFPRLSSYVLAASTERNQGANTAALAIGDSVGGASAIAISGLVFTSVGSNAGHASFVATLGFCTALSLVAVLASRRTGS